MEVERVRIEELKPDPLNNRVHTQRNLDAIKGSLERFGQQKPIVVDKDNLVVAGNGTMLAAKELGWEELDVQRTALGREEAIAYALADNRAAELAEWDSEGLRKQLEEGMDLEKLGWTPEELPGIDDVFKQDDEPNFQCTSLEEEGETATNTSKQQKTVKFSKKQAETVERAITLLRVTAEDEGVLEADALTAICSDWIEERS
jgi:hypothetical protein